MKTDEALTLDCDSIAVTVDSLRRVDGDGSCKAFLKVAFSTRVGEIIIDNFRLVESKRGALFVSPPAHQKDGKWYDDVKVTGKLGSLLNDAAIAAYEGEVL
jgi:DNA-binding cell septation regulator SpoVG